MKVAAGPCLPNSTIKQLSPYLTQNPCMSLKEIHLKWQHRIAFWIEFSSSSKKRDGRRSTFSIICFRAHCEQEYRDKTYLCILNKVKDQQSLVQSTIQGIWVHSRFGMKLVLIAFVLLASLCLVNGHGKI